MNSDRDVHIPYVAIALEKDTRKEVAERIVAYERELLANYSHFTPDTFPGVRIPFTKLVVKGKSSEKVIRETVVMGIAGTPFTGTDILLWRAHEVQKRAANTVLFAIGHPNSHMGTVTKEWIDAQKLKPFMSSAESILDLVDRNTEGNVNYDRVIGMSLGGPIAYHMIEKNPQLHGLLINPPAGISAAFGYPVTILGELIAHPILRTIMAREAAFYSQFDRETSPEQKQFQKESLWLDAKNALTHNVVKNAQHNDAIRRRIHFVQGRFDGTSRPHSLRGFDINTGHWVPFIDRI